MMAEGDRIRYYYSLRGGADELVATVVLQGWANIESLNAPEVPRFAGGAFGVSNDAAAWWSHGCSLEVVWSIDTFPC